MIQSLRNTLDTNAELLKIYANDLGGCKDLSEADSVAGFVLKTVESLLAVVGAINDANEEIDTREDFLQTLTIISGNLAAVITAGADAKKVEMVKSQIDNKIAQLTENSEETV